MKTTKLEIAFSWKPLNRKRERFAGKQTRKHLLKVAKASASLGLIFFCLFGDGEWAKAVVSGPTIQGVLLRDVSFLAGVVTFTVDITGSGFGNTPAALSSVELLDAKGTMVGTIISKQLIGDNKITFQAQAPLGTAITAIKITIGGVTVEDSNFKLSLKAPAPPAAITPFEIKQSTLSSPNSPIKTLFITNDKGLFSSNPHRMSVEILPAGASNILIRSGSNPSNLIVDFVAPEHFEVSGVVVTVYDSSDLDSRQPIAVSQPFQEKKPQADPNQPTITSAKVVYLQRRFGFGRLLIEGSGFGNYLRPPLLAGELLASYRTCLTSPPQPCPTPPALCPPPCGAAPIPAWEAWSQEIEKLVNIALVPRNNSLGITNSKIVYIDDKMIDVYFEFTQFNGYSVPFRLASTSITVTKPGAKQLQVLKAPGVNATIEGPETYLANVAIGPKRSENLTSNFTILSNDKANYEFGRGIADNFYVIKLSVVNRGEKKVSIPLAAIEAEVDWASGNVPSGEFAYVENKDPETPVPLDDVSAYFDAYQKQAGKRAKLFNIFSGMTTLMTSFIPIFGPGFKDAQVIFTGGLVPGIRQGIGDLSGQQLQNLTGRTWQNVEVIPDHGGSITKYVFIQRGEQLFNSNSKEVKPMLRKLIMNIRGIEVTGFEVTNGAAATTGAVQAEP
ncbi:MAG: hypothetical protein QOG23_2467 [Blastocatellia bacterium]|nr:hypothetical protein [Blastocatellia bacterium]